MNKENKDWIGYVLFMFLGAVISYLFIQNEQNKVVEVKRNEVDTLYKHELRVDTFYIQAKPKILRDTTIISMNDTLILRDTVIQTKPFMAQLDTITNKYALYMSYAFPKNEFKYNLVIKDSIKYVEITNIKFTNEIYWYQKPEYVIPLTILTTIGISNLVGGK